MLLHCCVADKWHSVCEKKEVSSGYLTSGIMCSDKLDQQRDDLIDLWSLNGARSLTKNDCFFF